MLRSILVSLAAFVAAALTASVNNYGNVDALEFKEFPNIHDLMLLDVSYFTSRLKTGAPGFADECHRVFPYLHEKIASVEDVRTFGHALPRKDDYYLGIALLHLDFDTDDAELMSYVEAIAGTQRDSVRMFVMFPVITGQAGVHARNKMLFNSLKVDPATKVHLNIINDIKHGTTNDISKIDRNELASVFIYWYTDFIFLSHLAGYICNRPELADGWAQVGPPSSFAKDSRQHAAELVFNPTTFFLHADDFGGYRKKFLTTFIPHFWSFQPTTLAENIARELRQFIKNTVNAAQRPMGYLEEEISLPALHLYSLKDDAEMVQLLTDYFLQHPKRLYGATKYEIPYDSAVWMGPLGVEYVNHFTNANDGPTNQRAHRADILRRAILRRDLEFVSKTNVDVNELMDVAKASRAIPEVYADENQFTAELAEWMATSKPSATA